MKKIKLYVLALLFFALISCNKDEDTLPTPNTPFASFTMEKTSAAVDELISFTNTSQNADSYTWDFGDGKSSHETSPTYAYAEVGSYIVTLTATGEGGEDVISKDINILVLPNASFSVTKDTFYTDEIIQFSNLSTDATSYSWDFGDNTVSTDFEPTHTYVSEGTYPVSIVTRNDSYEDTFAEDVIIIKFTGTKAILSPGEEFEFYYSTTTSFAPSYFEVSYTGEGQNHFSHTGFDWISFIQTPGGYLSGARFHYTAAANTPVGSYVGRFSISFKKNNNTHTIEKKVMFIVE